MSSEESRPIRANAGRNIGKLVNQELGGDEFYSSLYGGFEEEEEDLQYETEGSDEDTVDSDFDVDESQWGEPTETEVEETKRKKEWIKAYKAKNTDDVNTPKPKKPRSTVTTMTLQTIGGPEPLQRTFRKSTQHVSQEYKKRFELVEEEQRRRKMYQARRAKPERKLTQQELLEEAKITERENLGTLEAYSRMEAEKKKVEKKKVVYSGPVIRFHSTSMPFVTEIVTEINNKTIDHSKPPDTTDTHTQGSTSVPEKSANSQKDTNKSTNKYTRNFLVFTDTQGFPQSYFPTEKPKYPRKRFCPVTGLPAKYVDPLTGTPYTTSGAFRVIRNRYVSEGEQTCERRLLQLSSWLLEKKRKKMEETL